MECRNIFLSALSGEEQNPALISFILHTSHPTDATAYTIVPYLTSLPSPVQPRKSYPRSLPLPSYICSCRSELLPPEPRRNVRYFRPCHTCRCGGELAALGRTAELLSLADIPLGVGLCILTSPATWFNGLWRL